MASRPLADRLAEKLVAGPNGCIIFTGTKNRHGYGTIRTSGGRKTGAHRAAYELFWGVDLPADVVIDHEKCDNPSCCNPYHLKATTQKKNVARSNHPSAIAHREQRCGRGHEYNKENTYVDSAGKAHCRVCARERWVPRAERAAR